MVVKIFVRLYMWNPSGKSNMEDMDVDHNCSVFNNTCCPNEASNMDMQDLDSTIIDFMKEQKIPGGALVLAYNGRIIYRQGFGHAGPNRLATSSSYFRIASLSKTITAIAIMHLMEQGKLKLSDKVFGHDGILKEHIPSVKKLLKVTVKHLLQHSGGWDRDKSGDVVFLTYDKLASQSSPTSTNENSFHTLLVKYMLQQKLDFSPGRCHRYSNFGYLLLGWIIERVTGIQYVHFIQEMLKCVEMDFLYEGEELVLQHYNEVEYFEDAFGPVYSVLPEFSNVPYPQYGGFHMQATAAYGGLVTSPILLIQIVKQLDMTVCCADRILKPSSIHQMLARPYYESDSSWYGFGLDVEDNGASWGHTGYMDGTSSSLYHHKSGFSWILLFNSGCKDMDLNGLITFALYSKYSNILSDVHNLRIQRKSFRICSNDKLHVYQILLPLNCLSEHVQELQEMAYFIQNVDLVSYENELYLNLIWNKNIHNLRWFLKLYSISKDISVEKKSVERDVRSILKSGFSVQTLSVCTYRRCSHKIKTVIVFIQHAPYCPKQRFLFLQHQGRQKKKINVVDNTHIVIQSVCVWKNELFITAVMEDYAEFDTILKNSFHFHISPDQFVKKLCHYALKQTGLLYVQFYCDTVVNKTFVSAVWSRKKQHECYQRYGVTRYGFLRELIESTKNARPLEYISAYCEEGVLNFAGIWKANGFSDI